MALLEAAAPFLGTAALLFLASLITADGDPPVFDRTTPARDRTDTHTDEKKEVPDVLTTCTAELTELDPIGTDALDPLSKQCPDDLPCRVEDPDLWFADTPVDLERAKAFCATCPARAICLAGAVERREPWGVWGGEIFERGTVVARKRPRGRPRKSERTEVAA